MVVEEELVGSVFVGETAILVCASINHSPFASSRCMVVGSTRVVITVWPGEITTRSRLSMLSRPASHAVNATSRSNPVSRTVTKLSRGLLPC